MSPASLASPASLSLEQAMAAVAVPDAALQPLAKARLDSLTKPRGSLGRLEELAATLFVQQGGRLPLRVTPARCVVMAGDHGVAGPDGPGVSAFPQVVTRQMVLNFVAGGAAINALCRVFDVQLQVVDAGCAGGEFPSSPSLVQRKIRPGTRNFLQEPAMTLAECREALELGVDMAAVAAGEGVRVLCLGEMGIGNTTAATALQAALLHLHPRTIVGPGAGLDEHGVSRKAAVVAAALEAHPEAASGKDPLLTLATFGGLEIAGLAGLAIGAAAKGLPVMVDGFIATAAAVAALALCPALRHWALFAHASAEPGHALIMDKLQIRPLLHLDMRLGEGTGAVLACQLLRAAAAVINDMATFDDAGVSGQCA